MIPNELFDILINPKIFFQHRKPKVNKIIILFTNYLFIEDLLERIKNSTFQSTNKSRTHESTSTASSNHDHSTTNGTSSQSKHRTTSASTGDYTSEEAEAVRK
jgi:hypothetical protein